MQRNKKNFAVLKNSKHINEIKHDLRESNPMDSSINYEEIISQIRNEQNSDNNINRPKDNRLFQNLRKFTEIFENKSASELIPAIKFDSLEKNINKNAKLEEGFKIAEEFVRKSPNELIKNQDYLSDATQKLTEINKKLMTYYMLQQQVNLFTNLTKNVIMEKK